MRFFSAAVIALSLVFCVSLAAGPTCMRAQEMYMEDIYPSDTTVITNQTTLKCGTRTYKSYGEWYNFTGDGNVVTLDTCNTNTNFDTIIMVFQSCDQDKSGVYTDCITLDDDGCGGKASSLTFLAESMHRYHVFVGGVNNERGTYYFTTAYGDSPAAHTCDKAQEIENFPYASYQNTTLNKPVRDECLRTASSGMWYKVWGGGLPVMAHTCNYRTDFDTVIELYGNCSETGQASNCLMYNNDACYKQSLITWEGTFGAEYWLFVTGLNNARGHFVLAVEHEMYHPNGVCTDSVSITALPFHWRSNTAYLEQTLSECRNTEMNAMWFRLHGATRKVIAHTCQDNNARGDTVIDVYRECNSETREASICIASNDDYCGVNAAVIFDTISDQYFIAVSSFTQGVNGVNFSLTVSAYDDTDNSLCWNAKAITQVPSDLSGSTRDKEPSTLTCDGSTKERKGAWYRYDHHGAKKILTATTNNRQNILAARLEVYDDCNTRKCVAQADYDKDKGYTELSFEVEDGKTYNLFITASNTSDPGSFFHVDFVDQQAHPASNCSDPIVIQRGSLPLRLENYTGRSTLAWSSCYNEYKRGVWVQVVGTGGKMIATTCNEETNFDTTLELYGACPKEGTYNDYCLARSDDDPHCGSAATITWNSDKNAVYWIFVAGYDDATGVFVLTVYDKEDPINSKCTSAKGIENFPYEGFGITTYASPSLGNCIDKTPRKGLWYEVLGNGRWMTIDTCDSATTFATEIEVYTDCTEDDGGFGCVNHAHDQNCTPHTIISFPARAHKRYYIFMTGDASGVFAEGEFVMKIKEGAKLPDSSSSSKKKGGNTFGKVVGYYVLTMECVGVVAIIGAVIYGRYRKRNIEYQSVQDGN